MASNKAKDKEAAVESVPQLEEIPVATEEAPAPAKSAPAVESVYSAAELADNHKAFNTYREIVVVALRLAGKETATFSEAKTIIEKFKNKEVQ